MSYNYSKLKGRIVEFFENQKNFAKEMKLSERSVSLKMHGKVPWNQKDIAKACKLLKIEEQNISAYFFAGKVHSNEL